MLATLNLQPSPVELLDEPLTTSASLLPDAGGEATSGFAHLLRLRVDASSTAELTGGELLPQSALASPRGGETLPQSGSELPIPAQQLSTSLAEGPNISLDATVLYPPLEDLPAEAPALQALPVLPPASDPVRLDSAVVTAESGASGVTQLTAANPLPAGGPPVTRPEVAVQLQEFLATAGERIDTPPAGISLHERDQQIVRQAKSPLAIPTTQAADINESLPLVDLPKRSEIPQGQTAGGVAEQFTEIIRPRGVVPQPVQTLHTQLNSQPSQAMFVAASTTPAGEVSYGTAAQQAMDLIGAPVRDSAWGAQLSERVVLMASNQFKTAEIRLTPAELGPLRVQVSVDDGAANVTFHSQHAVTREAIEQAMPRLREMLAENGLSLGQADVSEQNVAQGNKDGETDGRLSNESADEGHDAATDADGVAAMEVRASNGLVDTFA
jgi:flagellar hook-length control protein FliK